MVVQEDGAGEDVDCGTRFQESVDVCVKAVEGGAVRPGFGGGEKLLISSSHSPRSGATAKDKGLIPCSDFSFMKSFKPCSSRSSIEPSLHVRPARSYILSKQKFRAESKREKGKA